MRFVNKCIKGLGEVALRVEDMDEMHRFYEEIIGLELIRRDAHSAFFKIGDGFGGHTQVLALFDRSISPGFYGISTDKTTMDHFALEISLKDYDAEVSRLRQFGLDVSITTHLWVKWRSLYVSDPEGNKVEFVCLDETITSET